MTTPNAFIRSHECAPCVEGEQIHGHKIVVGDRTWELDTMTSPGWGWHPLDAEDLDEFIMATPYWDCSQTLPIEAGHGQAVEIIDLPEVISFEEYLEYVATFIMGM